MTTRLQERYWEWLADQAEFGGHDGRFHHLLQALHERPFHAVLPMDENRVSDGFDMRQYFFEEGYPRVSRTEDWSDMPVSVLEVVVALSKKLAFQSMIDWPPLRWAALLISNLGLSQCHGRLGPVKAGRVEEALDVLIYRRYDAFGNGSFFPVREPKKDMRVVDIWYQMAAYLEENE